MGIYSRAVLGGIKGTNHVAIITDIENRGNYLVYDIYSRAVLGGITTLE